MMPRLLLKSLGTLSLVVITWAIASTAIQKMSQAQDDPPYTPPSKAVFSSADDLSKRKQPTRSQPGNVVASSKLTKSTVTVGKDGFADFAGDVEIFDKTQRNSDYLWRLRVFPSPNRSRDVSPMAAVYDKSYDLQKFKVPMGTTLKPTFREKLPLIPGIYFVETSLYRIPDGYDPTQLAANESLARSMLLLNSADFLEIKN